MIADEAARRDEPAAERDEIDPRFDLDPEGYLPLGLAPPF